MPVAGLNGSEIEPAGSPNFDEASSTGRLLVLKLPIVPPARPESTPKLKPFVVSRVMMFEPTFLRKLRLTSANFTCRFTCNGVAVRRRLMTFVPSPTKAVARRSASAPSSGCATVPVSSTTPFIVVAVICASGIASLSIWPIESKLLPTRIVAE